MKMPSVTKLHPNALIVVLLLFTLAVLFSSLGELCGAVGIAGVIGIVARDFAERTENGSERHGEGPKSA